MESVLDLPSIGQQIPFSAIYHDVIFIDEEVKQNLLYDPIKPYGQPSDEKSPAHQPSPPARP